MRDLQEPWSFSRILPISNVGGQVMAAPCSLPSFSVIFRDLRYQRSAAAKSRCSWAVLNQLQDGKDFLHLSVLVPSVVIAGVRGARLMSRLRASATPR